MDDLKLVILPCREPVPKECHSLYNDTFKLWQLVWSNTLRELDGVEKLYSNEFTRFDFASIILRKDKPISLMTYSAVDLSLAPRHFDSWFECWPLELLEDQKKRQGEGLVAAWFCTHPEFRKSSKESHGLNVSQIIIEVFGKLVLEGDYNVGYGVTRNNRSVGKYSLNAGGTVMAKSTAHNCEVDLVLFEPEIIEERQLSYSDALKTLWNERIDYRLKPIRGEKNEREIHEAA